MFLGFFVSIKISLLRIQNLNILLLSLKRRQLVHFETFVDLFSSHYVRKEKFYT